MDDASLRQQFRINAMHGHDVGVWVCEGSGISLGPVLCMQALCPDPPPRPLLVKWKPATVPPKAFRKEAALPLIYSECGRLPNWPYHLHLFAPQAPVAETVIRETDLQDWSWAVPVIGIILIYHQKYDGPPATFSLSRMLDRSKTPPPNAPLAWVLAQRLPCVIAALDYEDTRETVEQFRRRYNVAAEIPVLPGPPLVDARRRSQGSESSSMFSSVFEHQKLAFDREYARAVLDKLLHHIERARTP